MITGKFLSNNDFECKLRNSINNGILLVQLRSKKSDQTEYLELVDIAKTICKKNDVKLILNTSPNNFNKNKTDGLHLSSQYLYEINQRPIHESLLLSVSCHTEDDIKQAEKLEADIVLLSPVKETTSHPGVKGIGWKKFQSMSDLIDAPVYALGGMKKSDIQDAELNGAQGIAAISNFWESI